MSRTRPTTATSGINAPTQTVHAAAVRRSKVTAAIAAAVAAEL